MTNLAVREVFFTLPHMPGLSDPPDPPNSPEFPDSSASPDPSNSPDSPYPPYPTDSSKLPESREFSKFSTIAVPVQCMNMITTLGGLKVYNDFNDVTMALEDDTQVRQTRSSSHLPVQN